MKFPYRAPETRLNNQVSEEGSPRYYGWRILAASVAGMILSPGPICLGTLGVMVSSFQQEFGWSRPELMFSLTFVTIASIPAIPLVGRLIDLFGVKRILIPSIVILGALVAAIPVFVTSLWILYLLFLLIGILTPGTQSISYINVLSNWFDRKRGLVIGITASGLGLGYMLLPILAHLVIEQAGWKGAYYTIAALIMIISLPVMILIIRDAPSIRGQESVSVQKSQLKYGCNVVEAINTRTFWLIVTAIFIFSLVLNGMLPNVVPLLTDRNMTPQTAAIAASIMGFAMFVGRLLVGYLIDIYFAPRVAVVVFFVATVGLVILAAGAIDTLAYVAIFMIGLGFGAETDLMGFLVTRYFGLKSFGQIYGLVLSAFLVGTGLGPYIASLSYQANGSYISILTTYSLIGLFGISLFFLLKPYPRFVN